MHNFQSTCCNDNEDRIHTLTQKTKEEYIQLGKNTIRLTVDASRRMDGYADKIIRLKQNRKGKDK